MCVGDFMSKENKIKPNKKYILILIITIIGVVIDQITKMYINYEFTNISCVNCLSEIYH